MKPVLEIPSAIDGRAEFNRFLIESLVKSEVFRIREVEFPQLPIGRRFHKNLNYLRLENCLMAVDTWDGAWPAVSEHPLFDALDLLLKIEYRPAEIWRDVERRHGLQVSAWTMFGYTDFPVGYFRWQPEGHRYLYAFSGDQKRPKRKWLQRFRQQGAPVYEIQSVQEYLPLLSQMRWGVILQGKKGEWCDGKNRREHAYTSLGMPLALNYQPHYPYPMRPGIDYVFLEDPDDLDKLKDIDPRPFAEASRRLWRELFSPEGMARQLLLIHQQLLASPNRGSEIASSSSQHFSLSQNE